MGAHGALRDSERSVERSVISAGICMVGLMVAAPAQALQPLEAFVASAKRNNPDNREAAAIVQQREAQRDAARGAYLPAFNVQGTYTRNQYEAAFTLPGSETTVVIQP